MLGKPVELKDGVQARFLYIHGADTFIFSYSQI